MKKKFRIIFSTALFAATIGTAVSADAAGYVRDGRKISLEIPQTSKNQVKAMRLTVVSDDIIRVEATPDDAIPTKRKSLVVVNREGKYKADVDARCLGSRKLCRTSYYQRTVGRWEFDRQAIGSIICKEHVACYVKWERERTKNRIESTIELDAVNSAVEAVF